MTNSADKKAVIADIVLKLAPPLIRSSLLNDQSFREEYGLKTDAMIAFGKSDVSVQRSELLNAVRTVLAAKAPAELTDAEDRTWNLTNDAREDELPNLVLSSDQQRLVLPDFSVLSGDASTRIRSLEESASDVNLPLSAQETWRSILEERALEDDEVILFTVIYAIRRSTWNGLYELRSRQAKAVCRLLFRIRGGILKDWLALMTETVRSGIMRSAMVERFSGICQSGGLTRAFSSVCFFLLIRH